MARSTSDQVAMAAVALGAAWLWCCGGGTHMTGRFDGKPFASNYRYIDIYVRRNGAWKIVSVQITKLPPESGG